MKILMHALLLACSVASAAPADSLNTNPATGNTGLDTWTHSVNSNAEGLAVFPVAKSLPLNPSGSQPFALTVAGDTWLGDIYCLAEPYYDYVTPGAWGCVYGASVTGDRRGPVVYQSNKTISSTDGKGGAGIVMWADRPNADNSGNRGYMDVWANGAIDSGFSNTLNFGNRDGSGNMRRRFRILNNGAINFPDLTGSGNAHLCIDASGTVYRGSSSGC